MKWIIPEKIQKGMGEDILLWKPPAVFRFVTRKQTLQKQTLVCFLTILKNKWNLSFDGILISIAKEILNKEKNVF